MTQKIPYLLALLGIMGGVFVAILFGVNESIFKDRINRDLQSNQKVIKIINPEEKKAFIKKEASKNWRYYQRYHFHATAIGSMSLGILILLSFSLAPKIIKLTSAYMISLGGFFYPFVWLFAAMYGPILGRSVAKERFAVFGYMGGIFLVGVILTTFLICYYPLKNEQNS